MYLFPQNYNHPKILNETEEAKKAVFKQKARTYDIKFAKYIDSDLIQKELIDNQYS